MHLSDCPSGFNQHQGFSDGVPFNYSSLNLCKTQCQALQASCKAFAYNEAKGICLIVFDSIPTHPKNDDYIFCSKELPGILYF